MIEDWPFLYISFIALWEIVLLIYSVAEGRKAIFHRLKTSLSDLKYEIYVL